MESPSVPYCGVAVMAKASRAGSAKTSLCPPLTPEEAADLNTAFLRDAADNLAAAAAETSLAGAMAFGPRGSTGFFRAILPGHLALHEICYADYGDSLREAMRSQFEAGHRAACILSPDSPTLPTDLLAEMVEVLFRPGERAVLGPSIDGGYYLLACKTLHPRLFKDIAWSTAAVAAQTLEQAALIGLPVHVLPEWYGVSDCSSLKLLAGEVLDGWTFSSHFRSQPALHSSALLKTLFGTANLEERMEGFTRERKARVQRGRAAA